MQTLKDDWITDNVCPIHLRMLGIANDTLDNIILGRVCFNMRSTRPPNPSLPEQIPRTRMPCGIQSHQHSTPPSEHVVHASANSRSTFPPRSSTRLLKNNPRLSPDKRLPRRHRGRRRHPLVSPPRLPRRRSLLPLRLPPAREQNGSRDRLSENRPLDWSQSAFYPIE